MQEERKDMGGRGRGMKKRCRRKKKQEVEEKGRSNGIP